MNLFALFLLASVTLEAAGDTLFKTWAGAHRAWMFAAGIGLYVAATVAWAISLRYEQLSKAIVIFTVLNLVTVVLIGVFHFRETLSVASWVGVVLGIVSVALLILD